MTSEGLNRPILWAF